MIADSTRFVNYTTEKYFIVVSNRNIADFFMPGSYPAMLKLQLLIPALITLAMVAEILISKNYAISHFLK